MGREESGHYTLPATPKFRALTLLGPKVREKSTHHIGYHSESTCLFHVIENIECVHKTAQVRSSLDTKNDIFKGAPKVSVKLLKSAVLWTIALGGPKSVHQTAEVQQFLSSIHTIRSAVLWTLNKTAVGSNSQVICTTT
jgi:hypothetical protein